MDASASKDDVVTMLDVLNDENGRIYWFFTSSFVDLDIFQILSYKFLFVFVFSYVELADQAQAVLSGSDEKNCNGFQKRQALYSCLTCSPDDAKSDFSKSIGKKLVNKYSIRSTLGFFLSGVCLACSFNCHEKHDLVELYTKRDFRCDCGIKQGSVKCQLDPTKKESSSELNKYYNQNFVGLYCNCHRPYPDSEITNNDEMIQCIVCEGSLGANLTLQLGSLLLLCSF